MAQAQVIISARDQTGAAIASVQSKLGQLGRSTATVARGMNVALAVLGGTSIKRVMDGVVKATAASELGQRGFAQALKETQRAAGDLLAAKSGLPGATAAMQDLARTLKDPGVVAAADAITSALIKGFAAAAKAAADVTSEIRKIGVERGAFDPLGKDELIQGLDGQIKRAESRLAQLQTAGSGPRIKGESGLGDPVQRAAQIKLIRDEIALLAQRRELLRNYEPLQGGGPLSRVRSVIDPIKAYANMQEAARLKAAKGGNEGEGKVGAASSAVNEIEEVVVTSTRRAVSAIEKLYADWNESTRSAIERQVSEFEGLQGALNELVAAGQITVEQAGQRQAEALEALLPEFESRAKQIEQTFGGMSEFAKQAAANMQDMFAQFLFNPFDGGVKGMLKGFIDAIRQMMAQAAAAKIFDAIGGYFGGKSGIFSTVLASAFGRATGGPVSKGRPYMVGEKGPELFVPGAGGNIVPNDAMGGVTVAPVYNIDARGATADLQKALPGILSENNRRIFDELDRRYGIGR